MKWNFSGRLVIVGMSLMLATSMVRAATLMESLSFNPYIGVEYQYEHIKGNLDWSRILPANFQNGAIFLGNKYHKNFGIELGYYQRLRRSRNVSAMSSFDGVAASATAESTATMKMKGFSFEWDVYLPLDANFNFMIISSLVTVHPEISITNTGGSSNLATALTNVKGRNRTILRFGVGAEYFEQSWGARGRVLWDHTHHLHIDVNNAVGTFPALTDKAFKQAITVTAGVFYKF